MLARAHTVRKRFEDTESVLAAAQDAVASLAGDPAAHDTVLDYLEQRMHALYWGLGRAADARALLSGARAWSDDPLWERRLLPLRLALTGMLDGFSGTVDLLAELLADPDLDAATRRMAEPRYAIALFYVGRSSEVHPLARRLRPSVPLGDYNDAVALGAWSLTSIESGEDWEDAEAYMRDTLRDAVEVNDRDAGGHRRLQPRGPRVPPGPPRRRTAAGSRRPTCTSSARTRSGPRCRRARSRSGSASRRATPRPRLRRTTA